MEKYGVDTSKKKDEKEGVEKSAVDRGSRHPNRPRGPVRCPECNMAVRPVEPYICRRCGSEPFERA